MKEGEPSGLDRLLRLFTDVRRGEGVSALLLALNVFLLLTSYYIMKVLREAFLTGADAAQKKAYAGAAIAALLLIAVPAYGMLAARVPRKRLIVTVSSFFVLCIMGFYVAAKAGASLGVPFYIWIGIFNLMIIAQFWAFANDVYTTDEGKRLFPVIAFGGSAGAVFGSWLPKHLPIGVAELLPLAAVLLACAVVIMLFVDRREVRRTEVAPASPKSSGTLPAATAQFRHESGELKAVKASDAYATASGQFKTVKRGAVPEDDIKPSKGSFALVFRNPYLLMIAFLILLSSWVNTNGEFILRGTLDRAAQAAGSPEAAQAYVKAFYSDFFTIVNIVSMVLQLFVVSRLLKYAGLRTTLLILPVLALGGYAMMAFVPVMAIIRWAKITENASDYSIQNTARQVLFLPTTREEKYSAKQATDGFFSRAGDLLSAGLAYVGSHWIIMATNHYAMVNLVLVVIWLVLAVAVARRYERLAAATAS